MFTSSIVLGLMRFFGMLLVLFYMNRKWINQSASNTFTEFLVHQWFKYGSIVGIVIFVTVQLNIYDLLNCFLILIFIIIIDSIGIHNIKSHVYFDDKIKAIIHKLLKRIELHKSLSSWIVFKKNDSVLKNIFFELALFLNLAVITFVSRYYFFRYDLYSLSNMWILDLEKINAFDAQHWFLDDMALGGDLAFVNFYSKITAVSPEIALQSIGILESILLSLLLFWMMRKITLSNYFAPIVAALSFALIYTLIPININFLLQTKSTFLALTFAFPAMVYTLKPDLLKIRKLNYFICFIVVFIVIGLIDLFTLYILLPPFFVISIFLTSRILRKRFWIGIGAYIVAAAIILGVYALACRHFETDFFMFMHANLLSVNSYTYIPQLVLPLNKLLNYYIISALCGILCLLKFTFYNKENWKAAIAFLLYFISLIFMGFLKNPWIDPDLLIQSLSAFIPIVIGINAAIIVRIFKPVAIKMEKFNKYAVTLLVITIVCSAVYYQKNAIDQFSESDDVPKQVLQVYDKISHNYFPYSYAVVNDNSTQAISAHKHYFMNYEDFLNEYPKQDSIYFKNIRNPKFFKKNPQNVIPKSVLLFVFNSKEPSPFAENDSLTKTLINQMEILKKRGRKIELFYANKNFKVYEIINEPKSSKISDLIF
ncbi:hypothetical protein [Flavobacterium sp. GT3R68]|uniref:hypothetical protein n=1 Tax=Flavobacterium sp. GT3R68 TaxID=2594437 RepID=UPI000F870189|nr:hypothetical protein [Flavobacterium sp. GT3R68]RTY93665.1 hypothetical protein EKL32_15175 [Flavobacterium sp. GSN2]TRW91614.1 hypothetical protein FNW07_06910 [Flavobacterium sp. GT3R68]